MTRQRQISLAGRFGYFCSGRGKGESEASGGGGGGRFFIENSKRGRGVSKRAEGAGGCLRLIGEFSGGGGG